MRSSKNMRGINLSPAVTAQVNAQTRPIWMTTLQQNAVSAEGRISSFTRSASFSRA